MVDIQGTKFPSADGLTDADVSLIKDYTEHYDQIALCDTIDYQS